MPIERYLINSPSFRPNDLVILRAAFIESLQKLGLKDGNDPAVELIARRIIAAAISGERDPVKLSQAALTGSGEI